VGVTAVGWTVTFGVIVVLLGLDLLLATVRPHAVGYKEAIAWSIAYVAVAVVFGLVFASLAGWGYGSQYFAGFVVTNTGTTRSRKLTSGETCVLTGSKPGFPPAIRGRVRS
jgi:hypothetical protein